MDLSNPSTTCAASLAPAAIAATGLTVVPSAKLHPGTSRYSPGLEGQGRWSNLLWALVLGSLAEASFAQLSLAQNNSPSEPAIVQVQEQVMESEEAGSRPASPREAIVIPNAPTINPQAEMPSASPEMLEEAQGRSPAPEAANTPEAAANNPEAADTIESITAPTIPEAPRDDLPTSSPANDATSDSAASKTTTELTGTDRVYLANQKISFVPPLGFTPMSPSEIETKFPGAMPPQYAYGNATRDVSVGVSVSEISLTPEQLPEVKAFLEDFLETSVPGFQWLEHDFVNLGGQDWIKLEFLSEAPEQRIHNDMYITSLQGKLLGFNFNANLDVDASLRPLLQDSRNSIVVDTTVAADE